LQALGQQVLARARAEEEREQAKKAARLAAKVGYNISLEACGCVGAADPQPCVHPR